MSQRPWYKRYPSNFISGTLHMSLEEKGAYSMVLDLLYDRSGPIPDDSRWISRVCGCSTRKWNQIRSRLIETGYLYEQDGHLSNERAEKEILSSKKEHEKLSENGAKGAEKTNEKNAPASQNNDLIEKGPDHSERHTRNQKEDTRKKDRSIDDGFPDWYAEYPRKVAKGAARTAYRAARKKASAEELIEAAKRYAGLVAESEARFVKHPATWLNGECWLDDERQAREPPVRLNAAAREKYRERWGRYPEEDVTPEAAE